MPKLRKDTVFPDLELMVLDHGSTSLSALTGGSWAVVYFYRAEWCPICHDYFDRLKALESELEAADLRWIAISTDGEQDARATRDRHGLAIPIAHSAGLDLGEALDLYVTPERNCFEPTFVVLDPTRTVRHVNLSTGPLARPAPEELLALVQFLRKRDSQAAEPVESAHGRTD